MSYQATEPTISQAVASRASNKAGTVLSGSQLRSGLSSYFTLRNVLISLSNISAVD